MPKFNVGDKVVHEYPYAGETYGEVLALPDPDLPYFAVNAYEVQWHSTEEQDEIVEYCPEKHLSLYQEEVEIEVDLPEDLILKIFSVCYDLDVSPKQWLREAVVAFAEKVIEENQDEN